jgi:hypothetical protein
MLFDPVVGKLWVGSERNQTLSYTKEPNLVLIVPPQGSFEIRKVLTDQTAHLFGIE